MLKNYFKIAWRNLWRNRIFSLINLFGLALGITAFVFILQYISYEYSYNRMHKNLPQLYRVLFEAEINGDLVNFEYSPPALATAASENLSDIQDYCRISIGIAQGIISFTDRNNNIQSSRENKVGYVDGSFFEIFDFPIWKGDAKGLKKPNQISHFQDL